ncbi:MAG: hypothetical protein QOE90_2905 [Thermoplasmata archaeon]|jgi:predicted transcriptional regulator with HTH domain|nr:hypothetical protein [Thermoplasmata archaeon]
MIPLVEIGRGLQRSHARRRVLEALDWLGRAPLAAIAEAARQTPARAHAVLHGDLPGFRRDRSLVALELVEQAEDGYEITARGRLVASALRREGGMKLLVEGPVRPAPREARRIARETCPACGHRRGEPLPEEGRIGLPTPEASARGASRRP